MRSPTWKPTGWSLPARRGWALLVVLGSLAATVSVGRAQAPLADTELTPDAKPAEWAQWTILGGAKYDRDGAMFNGEASPTPYTVDFFSTAFSPDYLAAEGSAQYLEHAVGFFAGAECIDETTAFSDLETCDKLDGAGKPNREPAIYGYGIDEFEEQHIERMELPLPRGPTGFVGAVAWIDGRRALAVGGTGPYPRFEDGDSADGDSAGAARAWLYEGGRWRELRQLHDGTEGDELPDGMNALTALDCARVSTQRAAPLGTCVAGGLRALWWWRPAADGRAEGFVSKDHPQGESFTSDEFKYRVRQVRFTHGWSNPDVVAVTSGCCAGNDEVAPRGAVLLKHNGQNNTWDPPSQFSPIGEERSGVNRAPLPDSYYGLVVTDANRMSAIASPGRETPEEGSEAGSRIVTNGLSGAGAQDPTSQGLTDVRLLAADGDQASTGGDGALFSKDAAGSPDGVLDWAVGRFKARQEGVAYTTLSTITPLPSPFTCPIAGIIEGVSAKHSLVCEPRPDRLLDTESTQSRRLLAMGTHALNALTFVPGTVGSAWAAGDRGAIARLGASGRSGGFGGAGGEPAAPLLRPSPGVTLSDREPFEGFRSSATGGEQGVVPPLVERPLDPLSRNAFSPWGSGDPTLTNGSGDRSLARAMVTSITMSRDGSEGWAIGSGPGAGDQFTLQHFDGERWSRCDPGGLGGMFEPDPACDSLRPLVDDGKLRSLVALARIPLERDGDAANDDEFAAIAVGTKLDRDGIAGPTVLAYQDGRWAIDKAASMALAGLPDAPQMDIAFRTPSDGWLAATQTSPLLYHYSGTWPHGTWVNCGTSPQTDPHPAECGEDVGLVPTGSSPSPTVSAGGKAALQLEVAGDTVFAGGVRAYQQQGEYPSVVSLPAPDADGRRRWRQEYDPGCVFDEGSAVCRPRRAEEGATPDDKGVVYSLSAVDLGGGRVAGWLIGKFGSTHVLDDDSDDLTRPALGPGHVLLRRNPERATECRKETDPKKKCWSWSLRDVDDDADALIPYASLLYCSDGPCTGVPQLVSFRDGGGGERSYLMPASKDDAVYYPPLEYDAARDRWQVMPAPFSSSTNTLGTVEPTTEGIVRAVAPDNRGGLWIAVGSPGPPQGEAPFGSWPATYFYRYASTRHRSVFADAPNPIREPITALTGTPDGDVWVTTESDMVYHYDRIAGWERLRITGWDPGRVVTRPSDALAVAVNAAGVGVIAGEQGRLVDVTPTKLVVDPATTRRCGDEPQPALGPCGTSRNLGAAAVAPDGSAMVGGESLALVWRPAGRDFRVIEAPRAAPTARVTDIAMPTAGQAWITLSDGGIWRGVGAEDGWRWFLESAPVDARNEKGSARLNALAVDAEGRGLAVGMRGAMLERAPDGRWTRLNTGFLDHLYSVALPAAGYGDGTLVGGGLGVVLTRVNGRFRVARPADDFDPLTAHSMDAFSGRIVGLAVSGGGEAGHVEAWAASQIPDSPFNDRDPAPFGLLHYSTPDPTLDQTSRALPLPDTPPSEPGEVTLAAFGRTECQLGLCMPFQGTNLFNEIVTRRIQAELRERRGRDGGAFAALFTGDLGSHPGRSERRKTTLGVAPTPFTPLDRNPSQDQWRDFVAGPLGASGVPLFGVPGKTDLSRVRVCNLGYTCNDTQQLAEPGVSLQWRRAFAGMPAPWGTGAPASSGDVEFVPVDDDPIARTAAVETPAPGAVRQADATGATETATASSGARTHYAVDMVRDGEPLVRLVFVDNSFARSLQASDAVQNPVEGQGGQAGWLERVLCIRDQTCPASVKQVRVCAGRPKCPPATLRAAKMPAVVVTNAPTYSHGPGGLDGTQSDASVLETLLLRHRVTAVVSGRLGWNGLFYTLASGLHAPCPGSPQPETPPRGPEDACTAGGAGSAVDTQRAPRVPAGAGGVADALRGLGVATPPAAGQAAGTAGDTTGAIPNVIASSAGGRFGPTGGQDGESGEGYWHGYSVVRIAPSGRVVVEQRPIFEWVGIDAGRHVMRPGTRVALHGYGREPLGTDTSPRFVAIDSPSITHSFDLVEADPQRPWLPKVVEGNGFPHGYVPLDPTVATISQTGAVTAGRSSHGRVYALAILSVGQKTATWPLVFEPRRSFVSRTVGLAPVATVPRVRVQAFGAQSLDPPSAPPPTAPPPAPTSNLKLPAPPSLPLPPGIGTQSSLPPVPPPLPPPSSAHQSAPLSLSVSLVGVAVPPTTGVTAQPTPPVNPSPPGGARKEAKQHQASAAKSEEGGDSVNPKDAQTRVNPVDSPHAYVAPRPTKPEPYAFTARARHEESATGSLFLYGGGLMLIALALALSWDVTRPGPRRRTPPWPAPAWSRLPTRRR